MAVARAETALAGRPSAAEYLMVPASVPLDDADLASRLERDYRLEFRELGVCDVYSLARSPEP